MLINTDKVEYPNDVYTAVSRSVHLKEPFITIDIIFDKRTDHKTEYKSILMNLTGMLSDPLLADL